MFLPFMFPQWVFSVTSMNIRPFLEQFFSYSFYTIWIKNPSRITKEWSLRSIFTVWPKTHIILFISVIKIKTVELNTYQIPWTVQWWCFGRRQVCEGFPSFQIRHAVNGHCMVKTRVSQSDISLVEYTSFDKMSFVLILRKLMTC